MPSVGSRCASRASLDRKFQSAVAQYESGHFAQAAAQLEALLRQVPESFEVHELLGLVYAAQSQDAQARKHLETAVRLKPDSAAARTNLAANLARMGKLDLAEAEFKKAIKLEPRNFDANHNLGELYARSGRVADAAPFLEQAQRIDPSSYDNGYDLALAYILTGRLTDARQLVQDLLKTKDTAELHNLLAEIEEKDGKFVAAANEYETAAHMDPSESNLFDWGSELLIHRTLEPAIEVFQHATERYPNSPRLLIGLGMSLYSRGNYDEAVKSLLRAADLNPSDAGAYLFLSKAYDSSPSQADEVIQRFRRFAELQPRNPRASYYYAMSLWKGKRAQDPGLDLQQIEVAAEAGDCARSEIRARPTCSWAISIPTRASMPRPSPNTRGLGSSIRTWETSITGWDRPTFTLAKRTAPRSSSRSISGSAPSTWPNSTSNSADIRQFVYSAKDGPSAK